MSKRNERAPGIRSDGARRLGRMRTLPALLCAAAVTWGMTGAAHAGPPGAATTEANTDDDSVDVDRPLSTPPSQPTAEARATAAQLYNDAVASARKGRAKEALSLFRAAYEQDGSPEALANMAVIEAKLGRPRAAAEHLARMLQNLPAEYASKMDDLKKRLAAQVALVGTIRLEIAAEGEVFADGKWVGSGPFTSTVYVNPGHHVVRLQARGVIVERPFDLDKGEIGVATVMRADVDALVAKLLPAASAGPVAEGPAAPPSKAVVATGASLAVAFAGLGALGVGVAVRAAGERAKIEDGVEQFGGACPASSPGFTDDCHARDQEAGNETIGKILAGTGFAAAGVAGLGTLLYVTVPALRGSASPTAARLQVLPAPGGVVLRGTF